MTKFWMAGVAVAAVAGAQAWALDSVSERMAVQDDYKPLGMRAGGFVVMPKVDVEELYDDNIYATSNNTESDFVTTVRPSVAVKSNWNRHALNALAKVEHNEYADNSKESHTNHFVGVDGKLDIVRDTAIGGGVSWERNHEDRGNPNSVATATEPTQVDVLTAQAGIYRELGRVNARFDTKAQKKDYKNGVTPANVVVDNNARDRNEYTQTLRVGYKATPSNEIFVRGTQNTRAYDRKGGAGNQLRSSHGTRVVVGSAFDITGKTAGEVYVGAMQRDYVAANLEDVSKPTWGANVLWNATPLTSVKAGIDREIEETTIGGSSSYVATTYSAGVEHALRRNIVVSAGAGYTTNDYQGAGAQREDNVWNANAGLAYLINRNLKAKLGYSYTDRDSNAVGGDYDRNSLMMGLSAAY